MTRNSHILRRASPTALLSNRVRQTIIQTRSLSSDAREAIETAVASKPVVLFMKGTPETPQCGFSRASLQILARQGVDATKFTAFNVLENEELRQGKETQKYRLLRDLMKALVGIKEYSDWPTIPQLYVGSEFVGGCDILLSMHQNGELSKLLEEKGVLAEASPEDSLPQ